jgi:DnaJ-class molecular chaperone
MRRPYPSAGEAYKAATTLGLVLNGLSLPEVVSAYRAKAAKHHPDNPEGDTTKFIAAKNARDLLERYLDGPVAEPKLGPRVCEACAGKGYVERPSKLRQTCVLCNGKG